MGAKWDLLFFSDRQMGGVHPTKSRTFTNWKYLVPCALFERSHSAQEETYNRFGNIYDWFQVAKVTLHCHGPLASPPHLSSHGHNTGGLRGAPPLRPRGARSHGAKWPQGRAETVVRAGCCCRRGDTGGLGLSTAVTASVGLALMSRAVREERGLETTNRYNVNHGVSERMHELAFGIVICLGSERAPPGGSAGAGEKADS